MTDSAEGVDAALSDEVARFATECCGRIDAVLPAPPPDEPVRVVSSPKGPRFSFKYRHPLISARTPAVIGHFEVEFTIGRDRVGHYMAVHESSFRLVDTRYRPIIRMEYLREPAKVPSSHIHVHAQSGPLTLFLARTGHRSPASVESLHIPTGGERFRPCIEDFLEFLIVDCGVAGSDDWREQVDEGRAGWRDYQARSVVRERPELAAEVLRELGAQVELPQGDPGRGPRNAV